MSSETGFNVSRQEGSTGHVLDGSLSEIVQHILQAIQNMEYGTIQITVHDSRVTQIDRIEKKRFPLQAKESKRK
ncbi:MAG: YezD family protein [Alicyclobacillus sp.]|nr:YezD family protein [Alicyclobacillus sp.]